MRHIIIIVPLLLLTSFVFSQDIRKVDEVIEEIIDVVSSTEISVDIEEVVNQLNYLYENPIDLNLASAKDLSRLYILNDLQIENIFTYRIQFGELLSVYELAAVDGVTLVDVQRLEPFVTVKQQKKRRRKMQTEIIGRVETLLQNQEGFKNGNYIGDSFKKYFRLKSNIYDTWMLGTTMESDAGEPFFKGQNRNGFDFYSGYIACKPRKIVDQLILGDFRIQNGLGLSLWNGYAPFKSSQTTHILIPLTGVTPYRSVDENRFMRGVNLNGHIGNFDWMFFYSRLKVDATGDHTEDGQIIISSLSTSGLHRTDNEIEKKNQQVEKTVGGMLAYRANRLYLGIGYFERNYRHYLQPDSKPYSIFKFRGNRKSNITANYKYVFRKMSLRGEFAFSNNGGNAFAQSIFISPSNLMKFLIFYRDFDHNYHSIAGRSFAETEGCNNEKGLYLGVEMLPIAKWQINAYYDHYQHDWLRYNQISPTRGYDWLMQVQHNHNEKLSCYVRLRYDSKSRSTHSGITKQLGEENYISYRIHCNYLFSDRLSLASRGELKRIIEPQKESGFLFSETLRWQNRTKLLTGYFRVAYFDTESYKSRIYIYENDALYNFAVPALFNTGVRCYLLIGSKISPKLSAWLRLGNTYLIDQASHGSGNAKIASSHKTNIKLQLRLKI